MNAQGETWKNAFFGSKSAADYAHSGIITNVTSPTGVPTIPDSVAGIRIVVTDSLVNTEA